ncbi:MAG: methyl-accepting chemotaxis protein [Treponema sp.]|jgi:methyl-accepting chemotaxis protein|nr:methyl-accepting chemotaxis protein [Treponema sp.]
MNILHFFNRSSGKIEEKNSSNENTNEFRELIANMRSVSRQANSQLSAPMDTAIIAGGLVGGSVKVIRQKTNELDNQINTASAAIDEISANIRSFNNLLEKQDGAVSQTGSAVEAMSTTVNNVISVTEMKMEDAANLKEIIEKGGADVMSTAQAIDAVTTGIAAVVDVIKVIDGIAAQTNLLAMNAAIEAAHAGEAGKGFAVVASEVRKLAESSTSNSKEIANSLKAIINQIQDAKKASESAGASFMRVRQEVEKFVGAFTEIAHSNSELSTGTQQIFNFMEDLKHVSGEISGGSKEIVSGTDSVDAALRKIKDFSNDLVTDMGNIEEKIYDISGAQSGIISFVVETSKSIENFYRTMEEKKELEKENTLFNYDLIVLMHRNWLIQLRAFLDGRKENLKATSEDHLKCDLGKWIYGDGKRFQEIDAYKTLENEHKNFHKKAGAIIQAKTEGKKTVAEQQYQELMNDYQMVVSLLNKLKQQNR